MIQKDNGLSVRKQSELLSVNRSSLYMESKVTDEVAIKFRKEIMDRIDYWHNEMPCIGSRKLAKKLQEDGYQIGRKLVRKYMTFMGIHTIYPKENLSKHNFKESIVPYLLKNYNIWMPNQVWSIDITYIKMHRSHMYLTAIIDWYSRKIVGWTLSDTLETQSVLYTVQKAVEENGIPAIINSDQGSQFTSKEYQQLLKELHIRQSMDGKSRWADNIMIERWFRSLKTELIYIEEFDSPRDLRIKIKDYIRKYNELRPHESLDYRTPAVVYAQRFST